MTKRIDDKSEAKQRMRSYLRKKGINMRTAEQMCGFNAGYLSAGGVVGSDKLSQFINAFPDCDLYYIITGSKVGDPRINTLQKLLDDIINSNKENQKTFKAMSKLVENLAT